MITQTGAIFLDAYRELNSKRLFWIVLVLSFLVVTAFAAVGINDRGLTVLWWEFTGVPINAKIIPPDVFYKLMYSSLGVQWWLAWISVILALVSTAGIIPDLVAGGSIELSLSKPIGRLRLFLTKYAAGLLFVALQVGVFSAASFFVLGLRGGAWEPKVFLAIPLVVLVFSYLFCMCALIGLVTRSGVAALLLTLLIWFAIFGVHTTERALLQFREVNTLRVERQEQRVARSAARIEQLRAPVEGNGAGRETLLKLEENTKTQADKRLVELTSNRDGLKRWHTAFLAIKTVLPKTTETIELLRRELVSESDLANMGRDRDDGLQVQLEDDDDPRTTMATTQERVEKQLRGRSVWWIIGTSLAFQAVVLGIAGWIFVRRDF
jgi:hypothetical protein